MAQNPFDSGMTDLGLLSQVSSDVLGNPGSVQKLKEQLAGLQATLGQPPPAHHGMLSAAIEGAMAGSRSTYVDPLTGAEFSAPATGTVPTILAGLQAGIKGREAETLARYDAEQKRAQAAQDHQEKLSAGIRMVLAQNPLAFEPLSKTEEGQRVLGMLAYGIDVPIDPAAKSAASEETLGKKMRMSYYVQTAKSSPDPAKRAEAFQALTDMLFPDGAPGGIDIKPEDMVQGKVPSWSDVGRLYGDTGLQALKQYNVDGDLPAFMSRLGTMKPQDATKMSQSMQLKIRLARSIAEVKQAYRDANGKDLMDLEALKQLPDEDRVLAENQFRNITGGQNDIEFIRYISAYERAYDDQPLEVREVNPEQAASDAAMLALHRVQAARQMKKRVDAADQRANAATPPPPVVTKSPAMSVSAWQQLAVARAKKDGTSVFEANKALVVEYDQTKKSAQVPALARSKAGAK